MPFRESTRALFLQDKILYVNAFHTFSPSAVHRNDGYFIFIFYSVDFSKNNTYVRCMVTTSSYFTFPSMGGEQFVCQTYKCVPLFAHRRFYKDPIRSFLLAHSFFCYARNLLRKPIDENECRKLEPIISLVTCFLRDF